MAFAVFYMLVSLRWPMLDDSPIMHYVNFLLAHGMRPYSDITDNNMPGAYMAEGLAMHLFGGSDLAWRVFEFSLLSVLGCATILIARPYDWLAGVLGSGFFLIMHSAEGPLFAGEREEMILVSLMVAYACLFEALRHRRPWLMGAFGLAAGAAVSIKPTYGPLPIFLVVLAAIVLRRRRDPLLSYLGWAAGGLALAGAIVLLYLLHYHAVRDFMHVVRNVTPAYRGVWSASFASMLARAIPRTFLPVVFLAAILALFSNTRWTWEQWALLLGAAIGLASYLIQHKGFVHHRYTLIGCCFLLCGIEIAGGLKRVGWRFLAASAAILYVCLVWIPRCSQITLIEGRTSSNLLERSLAQDLTAIAGGHPAEVLSGQVLCFDVISGCLSTLYHLGVVENQGFTGDLLLFRSPANDSVSFYRNLFWQRTRTNPPALLVITSEWFGEPDSFHKLDTWPEFAADLQANYIVALTRSIPSLRHDTAAIQPRSYRIYLRRGSALAAPSCRQGANLAHIL